MGFIFGGNTGETADSADSKRKLAYAMLQKGMDTSPVQSWTQGAARVAEAVMGGLDLRKQDADQKDADAQSMALITGSPYTPPPQSSGFLSSLFGANKVPASDAQGEVAAASPEVQAPQKAEVPPDQIKALIAQNVPPELQGYATNLIGHESSFNPNAVSPTGATGLAQFTKGTGKQYGLVGPNGDQRADPVANLHALVALTNDNKAALTQALGRPPTDGELALAHQQGVGGAISLLSGKNVPSQNLAVNNIDPNSDPRVAAAKIMKFYGGAGGPQVASLDPSAGMGEPQQQAYVDPQVVTQQPSPAAQAIQQQAPIPGPGGQMPPQDPTQTASVGPMQPPQAAPPMAAPVNIPNQPISNPMPADLSGVGMGGAAPGPGQFPAAPSNPQAQLATAMQGGAPQQAQANPQQQLAQAMQSAPVAPNPMRDNPRVQQLMRAMSNPNASPQMRAMVGAALQQEMSRGEDEYKLKLDAWQKQQDPAYQVGLQKGQLELQNLQHPENVIPESVRTLNARAAEAGLQPNTPAYQEFMRTGGQVQRNESPPPAGYRNVRDAEGNLLNIEPIPGGPAALALQTQQDAKDISTNTVTDAAKHAREAVFAKGTLPAIGSGSEFASNFASSNAAEVRKDVATLKANASLGSLSAMRKESPTGAALGSVTGDEEKLLADKVGPLDPNSPHFLRDLDAVEKTQLQIIHGKEAGLKIWADGNPERYPNAPKIGTVDQGHRYIGGNPGEPDSWEAVK